MCGIAIGLLLAACGTRVTGDSSALGGGSGGTGTATSSGSGPGANGPASFATGSSSTTGQAASGSGSRSGRTAGRSGPGVTATEIRIGMTAPLSGLTGFVGDEAVGAMNAYFQLVNARDGGVNGRRLKLIAYDDRLDTSQMLANARRLVEQDKVFMVVGTVSDSLGDYVTRLRLPTMVYGATPISFSSRFPTVFPIVGNALAWTHDTIASLRSFNPPMIKQGMRVAIMYETEIVDLQPYVPFFQEAWELAGAKVVSKDAFNYSDGDCTSLVRKMKSLDIDYWDMQGLAYTLCLSAGQRQRYRPHIGWGSWVTSSGALSSQVGPWIEGVIGGNGFDLADGRPRAKTAAHVEYIQALQRYQPNLARDEQHYDSPVTLGYWMGAKLLVDALRAQGSVVTRAGVNRWIQRIHDWDPGMAPAIHSLAPTCKTGSEYVWEARWHWDSEHRRAYRSPETGYFTSPWKDRYGGTCWLTKLADKITK